MPWLWKGAPVMQKASAEAGCAIRMALMSGRWR
jgi:hypothetical protein